MTSPNGNRSYLFVGFTLVALIVATRIGGLVSFPPAGISAFWPQNAILLSALLFLEGSNRKLCLLFAFPAFVVAELWAGYTVIYSLTFSAVNFFEVMMAYSFIRYFMKPPINLSHLNQFFTVVGALTLASVVGGFAGAGGVAMLGGSFNLALVDWMLADFAGFFVITPFVLTLPHWRKWLSSASVREKVLAISIIDILIVLSLVVYGPYAVSNLSLSGTEFLPIPIALLMALIYGPKGAAISVFMVSIVALSYALNGVGPFSLLTPDKNVESLQFFVVSLGLSAMLVGVLTQERKKAIEEKEILLREIHHRVKNNLQVVSSLLSLQADSEKNEASKIALKDSQRRIKAMARIHENLHKTDNLDAIAVDEYLGNVVADTIISGGEAAEEISTHISVDDILIDIDSAIVCGQIISELLSNCLKHAFSNGQTGSIEVSLHRKDEGKIELSVADNGKGLSGGFDIKQVESLGLNLVFALTMQLNGKLKIDGSDGTTVQIIFQEKM